MAEGGEAAESRRAAAEAAKEQGNGRLKERDVDGALEKYEESVKLDETFVPGWVNKGIALKKLSRKQDAAACFATAIRLEHDHAKARLNMSDIRSSLGNDEVYISVPEHFVARSDRACTAFGGFHVAGLRCAIALILVSKTRVQVLHADLQTHPENLADLVQWSAEGAKEDGGYELHVGHNPRHILNYAMVMAKRKREYGIDFSLESFMATHKRKDCTPEEYHETAMDRESMKQKLFADVRYIITRRQLEPWKNDIQYHEAQNIESGDLAIDLRSATVFTPAAHGSPALNAARLSHHPEEAAFCLVKSAAFYHTEFSRVPGRDGCKRVALGLLCDAAAGDLVIPYAPFPPVDASTAQLVWQDVDRHFAHLAHYIEANEKQIAEMRSEMLDTLDDKALSQVLGEQHKLRAVLGLYEKKEFCKATEVLKCMREADAGQSGINMLHFVQPWA
eukprot:gene8147-12539_t